MPNQIIVRKNDRFAEMYLIESGYVILSLKTKWQHEFFKLPSQTYFGDYQILLNYVSRECYTSGHKETRMMCIRKKKLLELLETFPLINEFYVERAKKRRIEFRRIKAIYLEEH